MIISQISVVLMIPYVRRMYFNDFSSISFLNFLLIPKVLSKLPISSKNEYVADKGDNITFTCTSDKPVLWIRRFGNDTLIVQNNHTLLISNVSVTDAGLYACISKDTINSIDTTNNITFENSVYHEYLTINLYVRTTPGPVTTLDFKASTILGYLIWRFNKANSGGYPVKSFTAEYRHISPDENKFDDWSRLDPINISPNVRQMEVYHLLPNTTYEFRIWANNQLGAGDIVTMRVTTLPEIKEDDLVQHIQADIDNFDPRVWMIAVSIFLGTLIVLATGLCIVLSSEFTQTSNFGEDDEDGLDSIELVPHIVLNPGFCESNQPFTPYAKTTVFGEDNESYEYEEYEPPIQAFKRKVSIFFTGQTISRI